MVAGHFYLTIVVFSGSATEEVSNNPLTENMRVAPASRSV